MPSRAWLLALPLLVLPARAEEQARPEPIARIRQPGGVGDIRFSPDGLILAIGGFNRKITLYYMPKGNPMHFLEGHTGRVTCLAWSPDSRTLASGSDDGSIRIWDVQSLKAVSVLEGVHGRGTHGTGTTSLGYFPDGKSLYSSGYDPTIRIWDVTTLKEIRRLEGHQDCAVACLSADGKVLISASQDGTALAWDPATGKSTGALEILPPIEATNPHLGNPCLSPDGRRMFAGGGDGRIRSWTLPDRKPALSWQAHGGFVCTAEVSPDGGLVVSGGAHPQGGLGEPDESWDNTIRIWDAATGQKLLELTGHAMSVSRCRFNSDGTRLVTSSWDGGVLIWDVAALGLWPVSAANETDDSLWKRLGEDAGTRAWTAMRALASRPDRALDLIGKRLQPAAADPGFADRLARLIRDLDDDAWEVRDKAQKDLTRLGPRAETALRKALAASPSPEVEMRVTQILEEKPSWTPETEEERRWSRAVKILEDLGGEKAAALLAKLAGGDADGALTALAKEALEKLKDR